MHMWTGFSQHSTGMRSMRRRRRWWILLKSKQTRESCKDLQDQHKESPQSCATSTETFQQGFCSNFSFTTDELFKKTEVPITLQWFSSMSNAEEQTQHTNLTYTKSKGLFTRTCIIPVSIISIGVPWKQTGHPNQSIAHFKLISLQKASACAKGIAK